MSLPDICREVRTKIVLAPGGDVKIDDWDKSWTEVTEHAIHCDGCWAIMEGFVVDPMAEMLRARLKPEDVEKLRRSLIEKTGESWGGRPIPPPPPQPTGAIPPRSAGAQPMTMVALGTTEQARCSPYEPTARGWIDAGGGVEFSPEFDRTFETIILRLKGKTELLKELRLSLIRAGTPVAGPHGSDALSPKRLGRGGRALVVLNLKELGVGGADAWKELTLEDHEHCVRIHLGATSAKLSPKVFAGVPPPREGTDGA
jgi:hypothetical protein